ncbi:LysR substrate-binding domain-containing protein [Bordetella petrii]|uniref:LysR substrate-binding domain-containing protein n=1 Tax=Bordetella petrii TaxID=94624 RepID=UPI001A979C46|nr:LysR substrate-binding domain-containing protein [Bordetella petrii]MBO1113804.1 LysR family transcriptional regulator [Bordetella petrii]
MDLRQLRYFVAVAEEASFTAAARRLNISQPPLSMQIKALEEALGAPLFERAHRSLRLTDAGLVFLEQARLTLSQMASAVQLAQLAGRGEAGLLRIAFTGSVPLVPGFARLVKTFRRERPLARLEIAHMPTGQQLQALQERRIDIGLLRPAPQFQPPPHLAFMPFWKDELRVAVPSDHPLAAHPGRISVKALAPYPLILFPREISCGLHDQIIQLFNRAGLVPQVAQEAREGTTIVGLVAAGVGISLLPDAYASLRTEGVHYARLEADAAHCPLLLACWKDGPSDLVQRFVKLARSIVADEPAAGAADGGLR